LGRLTRRPVKQHLGNAVSHRFEFDWLEFDPFEFIGGDSLR